MKRLLLIPILMVACFSIASSPTMQGKVTKYGLLRFTEKEELTRTPETPSGVTRVTDGTPIFIVSTNQIPAKIGVRFGFQYEIANVPAPDGAIGITKIVRHPAITKPDGTTSKGFTFIERQRVIGGRVVAWTGYGFDHDYELVTGDWEFEMQYAGQTVCKQKFTVYKE